MMVRSRQEGCKRFVRRVRPGGTPEGRHCTASYRAPTSTRPTPTRRTRGRGELAATSRLSPYSVAPVKSVGVNAMPFRIRYLISSNSVRSTRFQRTRKSWADEFSEITNSSKLSFPAGSCFVPDATLLLPRWEWLPGRAGGRHTLDVPGKLHSPDFPERVDAVAIPKRVIRATKVRVRATLSPHCGGEVPDVELHPFLAGKAGIGSLALRHHLVPALHHSSGTISCILCPLKVTTIL